jgi:hypothetical protein
LLEFGDFIHDTAEKLKEAIAQVEKEWNEDA